jgi:hypothetical protein
VIFDWNNDEHDRMGRPNYGVYRDSGLVQARLSGTERHALTLGRLRACWTGFKRPVELLRLNGSWRSLVDDVERCRRHCGNS